MQLKQKHRRLHPDDRYSPKKREPKLQENADSETFSALDHNMSASVMRPWHHQHACRADVQAPFDFMTWCTNKARNIGSTSLSSFVCRFAEATGAYFIYPERRTITALSDEPFWAISKNLPSPRSLKGWTGCTPRMRWSIQWQVFLPWSLLCLSCPYLDFHRKKSFGSVFHILHRSRRQSLGHVTSLTW